MPSGSLFSRLTALCDRPALLAAISGILIALSFPNAGLPLLSWVALIPLLVALEGVTLRTAFRLGFTCGLFAYAGLLYWINFVFTHYGGIPWVASIPLYLLLAAWLSLFYGLATLTARAGELHNVKSAIGLPIAWAAFDLLRSFLFTGIPCAMLGYSQYRTLPLIQIADITGVYGITVLIVLTNVVLYRIIRAVAGAGVPYPVKSAVTLLIFIIATLFYGFSRLNTPDNSAVPPLRAALIQGNIPQDVKWSPAFLEETISIYERLSREAAREGADLLIWPESAVPFYFQDEPARAERLRNLARELRVTLLFGSPAHELRNGKPTFLNSAFIIAPDGTTVGRSDKLHLVPFGEYVPLGRFFPFINKIVAGIGDFSPGDRAVALPVGQTRVGILICFEGVFPELARDYARAGARILVNITNDAWFGRSSAPYQHLSITVFRAVETRMPLLRAANTGVTTIIDKNGHIRSMTELFEEGFRSGEVTPGTGDSIYVRIGDTFAWLCAALTTGILLLQLRRKNVTKETLPDTRLEP